MAYPLGAGRGIAPSFCTSAVHKPPLFRRWLAVGLGKPNALRKVHPMWWYLRPGAKFGHTHARLNWIAVMDTTDWYDTKGDEAVLEDGLKPLFNDGVDEPLHSRVHSR